MIVYSDYCKKPFEIKQDTVYIRSDFKETVDSEGAHTWTCEEKKMSILDYLKEAFPENQITTDKAIAELMLLFSTYQAQVDDAIAELSMLIGGMNNV